MHCLRNGSIQQPRCYSFLILPEHRQDSTLQSLLLDPLELDLWRLPERPDFFRRPPRRPPLRLPLLELELELDDLELEEEDRLRRLRWSLRELPPPRDSSDDEPSLLRRRPRLPLVRRLSPSEEDDDDGDDEDDRRWRRCDDDRFRALLRLRERERDDDGESFLPRRDVSLGALVIRELLDAEVEAVVEGCLLTVRSALPAASSLAWFARSDLEDVEAPEDGFAADGPLPAWSAF